MELPNDNLRRHKLLPKSIEVEMPGLRAQDGKGDDAIAYLKLFCPFGRLTLYATEHENGEVFGYMVSPLGPDCDEWGYSSLQELASLQLAIGNASMPAIERDLDWLPTRVGDIDEIPSLTRGCP
jgi:hypothetical protein